MHKVLSKAHPSRQRRTLIRPAGVAWPGACDSAAKARIKLPKTPRSRPEGAGRSATQAFPDKRLERPAGDFPATPRGLGVTPGGPFVFRTPEERRTGRFDGSTRNPEHESDAMIRIHAPNQAVRCLFAVTALLSLSTTSGEEQAPRFDGQTELDLVLEGDMDRNGHVELADAVRLSEYLAGEGTLEVSPLVVDLNRDGALDEADVDMLLRRALGLSSLDSMHLVAHSRCPTASDSESPTLSIHNDTQGALQIQAFVLSIHNNTGEPIEWLLSATLSIHNNTGEPTDLWAATLSVRDRAGLPVDSAALSFSARNMDGEPVDVAGTSLAPQGHRVVSVQPGDA